jgi:hypothetical protein
MKEPAITQAAAGSTARTRGPGTGRALFLAALVTAARGLFELVSDYVCQMLSVLHQMKLALV